MIRFLTLGLLSLITYSMWGCATEIRDPKTGVVVFRSTGDIRNLNVTRSGFSIHADSIIQSVVIRASGSFAGTMGASIATSGILNVIK